MASISSLVNANDPYELLIQQMIRLEREPQYKLEDERDGQNKLKQVISDFDSRINALYTLLKRYRDPFDSPFRARTANVPEEAPFTLSSTDSAAPGTHTVAVEQLASNDVRVSQQFDRSASTLVSQFNGGPKTFDIEVASPTEADPARRVSISVTVDAQGTTNEEILKEIAQAVNGAMGDAVAAGDIESTQRANASVVFETSGTARLSIRSGLTGYGNRLDFGGGALLGALDIDNNAVVAGTGGGMIKDVGTSETDSELSSRFVLDGLTLYRDTNQISDAIDGATLTLKALSETYEETIVKGGNGNNQTTETVLRYRSTDFSVVSDTQAIEADVQDFIEKYNAVLAFVKEKTMVDGDLGIRADFAGDTAIRGLRFNLRSDLVRSVAGQPSAGPRAITDLGITIEKDGSLTLSDSDALKQALEEDPDAVRSLFDGDDGLATRFQNRLERFHGTDGLLADRKESIDIRVRRLDDRIDTWDDRMARREEQLRMQFARLQEAMALLEGQQSFLSGILY